ncbi:hypothetical protein BH20VER1_BH20VER1_24560 [soil metagenome]
MKTGKLIQALIRLNEVENALAISKSTSDDLTREREAARLRRAIPGPYLERYAKRRLRGKAPVVAVVAGVCRSCFLQLPSGMLQQLRTQAELLSCPNCGAFVYDSAALADSSPPNRAPRREAALVA